METVRPYQALHANEYASHTTVSSRQNWKRRGEGARAFALEIQHSTREDLRVPTAQLRPWHGWNLKGIFSKIRWGRVRTWCNDSAVRYTELHEPVGKSTKPRGYPPRHGIRGAKPDKHSKQSQGRECDISQKYQIKFPDTNPNGCPRASIHFILPPEKTQAQRLQLSTRA